MRTEKISNTPIRNIDNQCAICQGRKKYNVDKDNLNGPDQSKLHINKLMN